MKNFLKVLAGLVVLSLISGIVLFSRVNTANNKQALAAAVQEAIGYQLTIGGDLSLDFFPSLGLSLADVRLQNPAYPQELASTSRIVLQVELLPLLSRRIKVKEISAEDFHINYFVDAEGRSIWHQENIASADQVSAPTSAPDSAGSDKPDLSIERIRVANASLDMQNLATGSRYRLGRLQLQGSNANFNGEPFAVDLSFTYENNGMSAPIPVTAGADVAVDVAADTLDITSIHTTVTPMLVTGEIAVTNLLRAPAYSGSLAAEKFDPVTLMNALGLLASKGNQAAVPGSMAAATQLAFSLHFSGNTEQMEISTLDIDLDDAQIEAVARVRMASEFAPLNVNYTVSAGNIDLSPLFPQPKPTGESLPSGQENTTLPGHATTQHQSPEIALPVQWINTMTLSGVVTIESIRINDSVWEDIDLFTNIEDGLLDLEVAPLTAFGGSAQATLRLNALADPPRFAATALASNLNLVELAPSVSRFNTVSGFLQSESSYTASGSTPSALLDSLRGNTAFAITENSVDIGLIKQVFTAIAALGPTNEAIQQWPDVIRFNEVSGYHLLNNGLEQNQELKLRMDNVDISGRGGFELKTGVFDYDLLFTLLGEPHTQTIPINRIYHNVSWPVDCSAAFSDALNRYCRPDFSRVREIFTLIGTNAARSRLQEVITDQVPEQLQDSARSLLRSIFNQPR